jgi:hypothetical protein
LGEEGLGGWFGIECPRINFPYLDSAEFEKFQGNLLDGDFPLPFPAPQVISVLARCTGFP